MPRGKKPTTEKPAEKKAAAAPKKAAAAAPKKTAAKKAAKPVETKPVEPKPAAEVAEVAEAEVVPQLTQDFTEFMSKLQQVTQLMSSLRTEFRTLEKKANRELKAAQKANAKRKRKAGNRSPSGFVKPTLISNELATFLSKPVGTEMARTEVTREINTYIRANNLQDKSNGRKINADTKLSKLLKLKSDDELTYFNLQKYMSPHFAKSGAAAVANASV
jgi:upstream activation factor subunit UAF30|tara:strand:+ start:11 stop:664 length:654 start_codon:yes stop_codon:yes gene_type:complete